MQPFAILLIMMAGDMLKCANIDFPEEMNLYLRLSAKKTFRLVQTPLQAMFGEEVYNQTVIRVPTRFRMNKDSSLVVKNLGITMLIPILVVLLVVPLNRVLMLCFCKKKGSKGYCFQ